MQKISYKSWLVLKNKLLKGFMWVFNRDMFRRNYTLAHSTQTEKQLFDLPQDGEVYIWAPVQVIIKDGEITDIKPLTKEDVGYLLEHTASYVSKEEAIEAMNVGEAEAEEILWNKIRY